MGRQQRQRRGTLAPRVATNLDAGGYFATRGFERNRDITRQQRSQPSNDDSQAQWNCPEYACVSAVPHVSGRGATLSCRVDLVGMSLHFSFSRKKLSSAQDRSLDKNDPCLEGVVLPVIRRIQLEVPMLILGDNLETVLQRDVHIGRDSPLTIKCCSREFRLVPVVASPER